jgi:hypothetical protein
MATLTLGATGQPSALTKNFDSLFATSIANSRGVLIDNIASQNALFYAIMKMGDAYESADGGTHVEEELMYGLGSPHTYDGLDTLATDVTNGITKALFEWSQAAVPITISRKERRQNSNGIIKLIQARINQASMGMDDFFSKGIFRGNGAAALSTPLTDATNGSLFIEPLSKLVSKTPAVGVVGSVNPATNAWWANQYVSFSSVTTTTGLLTNMSNLYNLCGKGTGGPPNIIVCDQTTYELIETALYHRTRHDVAANQQFPFENIKFKNATIVWDEFVPDLKNAALATTTAGTMWMLNTKFMKLRYDAETNFIKREPKEPVNQDGSVSHILWMGQMTINNRRKQGVADGIPRTLTVS